MSWQSSKQPDVWEEIRLLRLADELVADTGLNFAGKQEMGEHVNLFSRVTK